MNLDNGGMLMNHEEIIKKLKEELKEELQRQINTRKIEEKFIEKNFISKDKIRELLKEVQFTIQHESLDGDYNVLYYMTGIENSIKELLEED